MIIRILWLCLFSLFGSALYAEEVKVYIEQIADHPALDQTRDGIIEALKQAGYNEGHNLDLRIESAQANPSLAQQIASNYIASHPDVVVGIGTVSAQAFSRYALRGETKLVFSSVTDPLGAGLVRSLEVPDNNTTGVSNFVALEPQLQLFKQLLPTMQKLGFLYNPGEANSVSLLKKIEELAPRFNMEVIGQIASKTSEVPQAAAQLASKVDAIFISNDSTALSALSTIIKAADAAKIPVFVSDTDTVRLGAVAALGPNQYQIGIQTGKMIVRLLQAKDKEMESVEFPRSTELYLNLDAAKKIGLHIPDSVRKKATKVMGG